MEPPKTCWASVWNFVCFLPYFVGLLLLGTIKGVILSPLICIISTVGHASIILILWPVHFIWTIYSVLRAKCAGPILKLLVVISLLIPLAMWPVLGIVASCVGGLLYGLFAPIFATFHAIDEGKSSELYHCFYDGTWDTIKGCCTFICDFKDMCTYTYFSYMTDIRSEHPDWAYHEINVVHLPGALIVGALGIISDLFMISAIAVCKIPVMLFKGWNRLFHDLVGREGPFLETICVPFAGLAILLWPLAVAGALLASVLASVSLGAYAGVVAYQERSVWLGLCYIAASLSIYDEYSNDVLDLPEGSYFPRPKYRREPNLIATNSFSSLKNKSLKTLSSKSSFNDVKSFEALDLLFKECRTAGDTFISQGLITKQDIESESTVLSVGLPAYCLLQCLLRSAKSSYSGLLLKVGDDFTEISTSNRPKDAFTDWFFNPFVILKDQIKAADLSEEEELYFGSMALFMSDPSRFKNLTLGKSHISERRRAEFDGLARRLQGLVKSMSRYPTSRRHFRKLMENLSAELAVKESERFQYGSPKTMMRSKSAFSRMFSYNSFKMKKSGNDSGMKTDLVSATNTENC